MPQSAAIVGANWGDEGKGKIVDWLAASADYVVRFQGGDNAGHTVINDLGTFALHLLPAGVFHPGVSNVLGPGVGLNPVSLLAEWDALMARGVEDARLLVSDRAHVVLPLHIRRDVLEEERRGSRQFGSTRRGMAPLYADKALKIGIRVSDLFDRAGLALKVHDLLTVKAGDLAGTDGASVEAAEHPVDTLCQLSPRLHPWVTDTTAALREALQQRAAILLEGQLGALRDLDHGIYPFTTSTPTLAGFAAVGAGIPPHAIDRIIAVTKAYSTAVGAGPLVSELHDEMGASLRRMGGHAGEFGATTGRPRRVGWFDAVATRYGCQVQGATELAITNLDVLGFLDRIPVVVGYRLETGVLTDMFPLTGDLWSATPMLESFPGWRTDISDARRFQDLPRAARNYVRAIEQLVGVRASIISVGPHRDQTIMVA